MDTGCCLDDLAGAILDSDVSWERESNESDCSVKLINDITNFDYTSESRRCICKRPRSDTIFCRFSIASISMLYKNTKVRVCSVDGDTDYFDIVAGVLQGDSIAPYLFIICLDYVLRTSIDLIKENDFKLTKARSRRCHAQTLKDADYADDIALLANTPA